MTDTVTTTAGPDGPAARDWIDDLVDAQMARQRRISFAGPIFEINDEDPITAPVEMWEADSWSAARWHPRRGWVHPFNG